MRKLAISKNFKNVQTEQNPNNFILDSSYNSLKITKTERKTLTLAATTSNQTFRIPHGLSFTPLVTGFAKETNDAWAFPPNMDDVSLIGAKTVITTGVRFNYIAVDAGDIILNFDNSNGSLTVDIKYYCLENI